MPLVSEGLASGELSESAVAALEHARDGNPEAFVDSESLLVEAARNLSHRELRSVVAYWSQVADQDLSEVRAERLHERRGIAASPLLSGMVRVDGDLDPEIGQTFVTALRSAGDADVRSGIDLRTPAQRRADALGIICRAWLDRSDRPMIAGERPHVVVTVDLHTLRGGAGGRCELDDAGPISPETARRIACDASVTRVISHARSAPLDIGRRSVVVPAGLRGAVAVRDGGCRFPGCDRPPGWCDAHHVRHWADGGATALSNLVMLCRPHHRLVHTGFGIGLEDGRPVFRRPDGSAIEDRAPPERRTNWTVRTLGGRR